MILDEAQAIKNPGTKQTKSVKKLKSVNRIVMTGTPVENRLSDLWSLFDFINPGLLGSSQEFGKFAKNLARDPEGYARLRKVISPYILRRLKTDKTVISDLPDKVEMKTWSTLSRKQAVLYQKLVDDLRRTIESTEGIQRKGVILSSLMKFKQLCNHPDQYLGTGAFDENESGKFGRLREICETIHEKRERVLVFTQFREITDPLSEFLGGIFQRQGLVLHGGTPVGKRKDIVARFRAGDYVPYMVLSLKAGGVGSILPRRTTLSTSTGGGTRLLREPGNRPGLQDRPEEERDRPQVHHQGDGRGEDRPDDRRENEALERGHPVRLRGVDHGDEQ